MSLRSVQPGELIYSRGEDAGEFYLILSEVHSDISHQSQVELSIPSEEEVYCPALTFSN